MLLRITAACLLFLAAATAAEARQRRVTPTGLHPMCNITMPCIVPMSSSQIAETQRVARGKYVAREVGIGGVAPKRHAKHASPVATVAHAGLGVVRAASGAVAHVAVSAAGAFQCFIDRLEGQGYPVRFMGGYARGGHIRGSLHYSGRALDVNQLARGVTRPRMPANEIELANGCGLVSGAQWAHNDSGHVQLGGWAGRRQRYADRSY